MDALGPRADEGRGKAAISPDEPSSGQTRGYPNGETRSGGEPVHPDLVSGGKAGELKHLSTLRKINQPRFPE